MIDVILEVLSTSLYPPRCPLCGREPARRGPGPCRGCRRRLVPLAPGCGRCAEPGPGDPCERCEWSAPGPDRVRACCPYGTEGPGGLLREAIHAWKYRADLASGAALAALFVERTRRFPLEADLVASVPTTRRRLLRRGFDPAAELARAIAADRGLPRRDVLRRVDARGSQTALGRADRDRNVRGAFRVGSPAEVAGRAILLVDDVLTTGATTGACAHALRRAGARSVELWALARAVRPSAGPP